MHLLRRWLAHRDFHRHFGHGLQGRDGGCRADGVAGRLADRARARLELDDEQQRWFAGWLGQVRQQREVLKGLVRGPALAGLLDAGQFPREAALQMLDARLDALRAASPAVVNAFADFFDSLDDGQRERLRLMARRAADRRRA